MKLIKNLYNLSNTPCILALENTKNKRVLLIRSNDALVSLGRVLKLTKSRNKKYRLLNRDYRKLEVVILETGNSRLRFQYWVDHYKSLGYSFYSEYKAIQYTPKIVSNDDYKLEVHLVSKSRSEVIVGVFNTLQEAEDFIATHYPKGKPIYNIIMQQSESSKL